MPDEATRHMLEALERKRQRDAKKQDSLAALKSGGPRRREPTPAKNIFSANQARAPPPEPLAYTVNDAAAASGLSRVSLYEQIKLGFLKSTKVCGRRLILKADLEAFLRSGIA